MKTSFKTQDSSILLKTYDYPVPVYPGMQVVLNHKHYTIRHAVLSLDKEEITVMVKRASAEVS